METYVTNTLEYRDTDTEERDVVIWFTVPKEWAEKWCKENNWESLEEFDTEYIWDNSWEMYESAKKDNIILSITEE